MINVVQGNVLRFLPPFLLQREHVDAAMDILAPLLGVGRDAGREQPREALAGASA